MKMPHNPESVTLKDKSFSIFITEDKILAAVNKMANQINVDFEKKQILFLSVLNGSFLFAADLIKQITVPCEVEFVKVSSYAGTSSMGNIKQLIGLSRDLKDKSVVVLEDIVDTGNTIESLYHQLKLLLPNEIKTATLLFKPNAYKKNIKIDYFGIEIPNDFIVGYGLDYDGLGRNLRNIYKLIN